MVVPIKFVANAIKFVANDPLWRGKREFSGCVQHGKLHHFNNYPGTSEGE